MKCLSFFDRSPSYSLWLWAEAGRTSFAFGFALWQWPETSLKTPVGPVSRRSLADRQDAGPIIVSEGTLAFPT